MAKRASFVRQQSAEVYDSTSTLVEPATIAPSVVSAHRTSQQQGQPDFSRRASVYSIHSIHSGPAAGNLRLLVPEPAVPVPAPRLRNSSMVRLALGAHAEEDPTSSSGIGDMTPNTRRQRLVKWLGRPVLPVLHVLLGCSHLGLATAVPVILVSNLVQPLVLWLILIVVLVLHVIYFLPGLVLEVIGFVRGRPVRSAWLQSGLHLTFLLFLLLPQALAMGLLSVAQQLPACTSIWTYRPLDFPTFLAALPGSACYGLPLALKVSIANAVVVVVELVATILAIQLDLNVRRRGQKELLRKTDEAGLAVELTDGHASTLRLPVVGSKDDSANEMPVQVRRARRRWHIGVGELLGAVELDLVSQRR